MHNQSKKEGQSPLGAMLLAAVAAAPVAVHAQSGAPQPAVPSQPAPTAAGAGSGTEEEITVIATRQKKPAFDVPASVDVITPQSDTLQVNLSETLPTIPGVVAHDRQNYAQDTQISIRGFGTRATFGIRGLRVFLDDIPATQPDGQGQVSHFNLATAGRVEVLRGPFSALYGNSSGGVIAMYTADGTPTPTFDLGTAYGSDGTWRQNIGARGSFTSGNYNVGYTHFETDGFRDHSDAHRESFNGKVNLDLGAAGRLTLIGNNFNSPNTQDPLGLTRQQFNDDPKMAAPQADQFNTRKSASQTQGGAIYEIDVTPGQTLRVLGYGGRREVTQFLAIPAATQANPRHSGGVVDLGTGYGGGDVRYSIAGTLLDRPYSLVGGLTYDTLSQTRRGYENFVGSALGVRGNKRRDENDEVWNFDQYLQMGWDVAEQWTIQAGVRHTKVDFDSKDHYVVLPNNPDDSGGKRFTATTPVVGVMFKADPHVHLYGSYGRGFETPTFAELAYRPDGQAGLNTDLKAARSHNGELGAKLKLTHTLDADVAVFTAKTRNELAVATNSGGRTTYLNAPRTRRAGVETSVDWHAWRDLDLQLAWTYLDAEVRRTYQACSGTPCVTPSTDIDKGNNLPGTPKSQFYGALRWGRETGWRALLEGRYVDAVPVNDQNSEAAPSYGLMAVSAGYGFRYGQWRVDASLRVDNVLDHDYVGSVIVNDGNGRFYEPGTDRTFMAVLDLGWMP